VGGAHISRCILSVRPHRDDEWLVHMPMVLHNGEPQHAIHRHVQHGNVPDHQMRTIVHTTGIRILGHIQSMVVVVLLYERSLVEHSMYEYISVIVVAL
jgi:hypothetical protein